MVKYKIRPEFQIASQENSSSSEELASNSEELALQAESLQDMISFFKIN